jgi:hypothetical protein
MLDTLWAFLQQHHRPVGIWGDSLTFLGGLLLSAEALFKKKDRLTLASIAIVVKLFPGAEDGNGKKLATTTEEDKQLRRWEKVAKLGVGLLTLGFLLLLLLRISE